MKLHTSAAFLSALLSALLLSACGGGGSDSGGSTPIPQPAPVQSSLTISLDSIEISQPSDGASVSADTSGISSGQITVTE